MREIINKIKERIDANPKVIQDRWERGVPHHPLSELLVKVMSHIDWKCFGLSADIKTGGDGDSGEWLMYLLDAYFEEYNGLQDVLDWVAYEGPI